VTFAAVLTAKDHNAAAACPVNLTQYSLYSVLYIEQGLGHVPKSCAFPPEESRPTNTLFLRTTRARTPNAIS